MSGRPFLPLADPVPLPASPPLAGGPLTWSMALGPDGALLRPGDLPLAVREVLTAPRPALAGLTWERPRLMGIVNVTPDSFSDGGRYAGQGAVDHARALAAAGADLLDIGGESTRPGAVPVGLQEELDRVLPVLEGIRAGGINLPLSVDTRKPAVARAAAAAEAVIWNDVSALTHEPESLATAAELGVAVCLMHARGTPRTMQKDPRYGDVTAEVFASLAARIAACEAAGIPRARILADPGIGFGKTTAHNLSLLRNIAAFHGLGVPILLGVSRKRFIGQLAGEDDPRRRLPGSLAAGLFALGQGVQMLRVHDMAETRQAVSVWQGITFGAEG